MAYAAKVTTEERMQLGNSQEISKFKVQKYSTQTFRHCRQVLLPIQRENKKSFLLPVVAAIGEQQPALSHGHGPQQEPQGD